MEGIRTNARCKKVGLWSGGGVWKGGRQSGTYLYTSDMWVPPLGWTLGLWLYWISPAAKQGNGDSPGPFVSMIDRICVNLVVDLSENKID